eukprot:scaffold343_cov245-Pinguiococcus_pyrenoidosus.AAC.29
MCSKPSLRIFNKARVGTSSGAGGKLTTSRSKVSRGNTPEPCNASACAIVFVAVGVERHPHADTIARRQVGDPGRHIEHVAAVAGHLGPGQLRLRLGHQRRVVQAPADAGVRAVGEADLLGVGTAHVGVATHDFVAE